MIRRIKVSIIRDLALPRFGLNAGDTWEVRPDRFEQKGFKLGGGFIGNNDFNVKEIIYK